MNSIMAIDPGPVQSAVVIWADRITHASIDVNEDLLCVLTSISGEGGSIVIEMIASYGMPVGREVFETVFWIGQFYHAAKRAGANVQRVERLKVKQHLCHDSRAKDSNIRQALIDRFGEPGTKKNPGKTYGLKSDLWQAFALAVYAMDNSSTPLPLRTQDSELSACKK